MRPREAVYLGVAAAVLSFVVGLTIHVISLQHALTANVNNQVPNRVKNVATWCNAINTGRDYDRQFVHKFGFKYSLTDLDCSAIERKTASSAKH